MNDEFEDNYETFIALLDKFTPPEAVKRMERLGCTPETIERIRERHEHEILQIRKREEPRFVVHGNRFTWYTGPQEGDKCWPAMAKLLAREGWPQDPAIKSLDESSTTIVSLLNHPREQRFSTRGLAIGYVQSGKTTNFTAVMAKAADRGYKLFIVLAGIHNGLRKQTQARLVRQLVEPNPTLWSQLTGLDTDFNSPTNPASYFGKNNKTRVLCVVKKNVTVLRKLAQWLADASQYLQDCPALIIDDEADQATVATERINPLILQILKTLPKSAYVGYTASPFANLLIDPAAEDLYPKDFIVNLPKPSSTQGYFGTEVLFGREPLDGEDPEDVDAGYDMIREVPEDDVDRVRPRKKSEAQGFTPEITDALRTAIYYFWLTTAARRVRATGNQHSTMLIHTSINTAVHESFRAPLESLRSRSREKLGDDQFLQELEALWNEETERVPAEQFGETKVEFSQLQPELPGVLDDCRIIMDNSYSEDRLDYDNGPVVAIAVGGNTLSRGLTLEGLSVSYFVRAASAYDTLLQMGRWFGYRKGYPDLPRIWMTAELREWFRHLATVEEEMRRDVDIYMTEDETPLTFAVRLRTHPGLRVTAAAKMTSAVHASSSYGGRRVQTRYFHTDLAWLLNNQKAARELITRAARSTNRQDRRPNEGRYIFYKVPHTEVINFLSNYQFHEESKECNAKQLIDYIQQRAQQANSLLTWNVAIIGKPSKSLDGHFEFAPGVSVRMINRSRINSTESYADIKTLMSRRDAVVDVSGTNPDPEEAEIRKIRKQELPDTGLLVLYPIDKDSEPARAKKRPDQAGAEPGSFDGSSLRAPLGAPAHVIGVGAVFPEVDGRDSTVFDYISADLSKIEVEREDPSAVEGEDAA